MRPIGVDFLNSKFKIFTDLFKKKIPAIFLVTIQLQKKKILAVGKRALFIHEYRWACTNTYELKKVGTLKYIYSDSALGQ